MRVRVSNFQSIERADLNLSGFSAITGASNLGKTALIRAISGAMFGMPGNHYVRKGATGCRVQLDGGDWSLDWVKGAKPHLRVNDEKHTAIGSRHAELTAVAGFALVEAGGTKLRPQVARQHDALFLLEDSPAVVAEVFQTLGRADVVARAQGAAKKDQRSTSGEWSIRDGDRMAAETRAKSYAWVPQLESEFEEVQIARAALQVKAIHAADRAKKIDRLRELAPAVVPDVPELELPLSIQQAKNVLTLRELAPRALPNEPVLPEASEKTREQIDALRALAPWGIPDVPELPDVDLQFENIARWRVAEDQRSGFAHDLWVAASDIEGYEADLEVLQLDLGACPTCNQGFA